MGITPAIANVLQRPGAVGSADSHLSADDTADAADDTGFDPADHTVEDVKAYVEANPDEAELVLAAEAEGKDRSTLIAWLNDFLNSQADDGG